MFKSMIDKEDKKDSKTKIFLVNQDNLKEVSYISIGNKRRRYENNIVNKFIYFTPISITKKRCLIPLNTKKKKKIYKEEELIVKGKNLINIFESIYDDF